MTETSHGSTHAADSARQTQQTSEQPLGVVGNIEGALRKVADTFVRRSEH